MEAKFANDRRQGSLSCGKSNINQKTLAVVPGVSSANNSLKTSRTVSSTLNYYHSQRDTIQHRVSVAIVGIRFTREKKLAEKEYVA